MNDIQESSYDAIIVGLSGLVVAKNLSHSDNNKNNHKKRMKWKLLEASNTLGGRLQNDSDDDQIDLGGAWIWPNQTHIHELLKTDDGDKKLQLFLQPGDPTVFRVTGGAVKIIKNLVKELEIQQESQNIETDSPVVSCKQRIIISNDEDASTTLICVKLKSGLEFYTKKVCFACPPRIISELIHFDPPLNPLKQHAMSMSETWMAGVTKVSLVYNVAGSKNSFIWPAGNDAFGNRGLRPGINKPAFQCYDASPNDGSLNAITFFTLASLSEESNNDNSDNDDTSKDRKLANACINQFSLSLSPRTIRNYPDIFDKLKAYERFHIKRWPLENYISSNINPSFIAPHPEPNMHLAKSDWNSTLVFAGTESDLFSPGVMEGAVSAANRASKELLQSIV